MPVWQASAARKTSTATAAPEPSPSRMPRSSKRMQAKLLKQKPMSRLGRHVTGERMVERAGAELGPWRHGGGADEAVEQRRDAPMPRGERGAEDGGKLAAAKRGGDAQRIAEDRLVPGERRVDRLALALEAAYRRRRCRGRQSARRRRRTSAAAIAEAAVVLPMPISPSTTISASGESASYPADTASRNSASSMAGCLVKSAVG